MTKLLALETSGTLCSVAIHADGKWTEDTQNVARLHNQVLLTQMDALARRCGVSLRGFDVIAFGAGPGSFTGVRIAAAAAQALAFASDAQVVPVSSSRALTESARQAGCLQGAAGVLTVIRSRRDAHYLAAYACGSDVPTPTLAEQLHQGLEAPGLRSFRGYVGVGDRPPWWDEASIGARFHESVAVTAGTIGRLALPIHAAGGAVAPEAALPIYVVGDSPWKPHVGARSVDDRVDAAGPGAAGPPLA